jgi:cell division protein FtsL
MNEKVKDFFLFGGMAVAIIFFSFLSLWQRTRMTRLGYEIQAMQKQKNQLLKIHKNLLIELESVSALDKIEEAAILQLSMIPAGPTTRVYLKDR